MEYYSRRQLAITFPELYHSDIGDGMAQAHNELPHMANLSSFGEKKLECHLQGHIVHGFRFRIARTFTNIVVDRNLAIYTWLVELELQYKQNGNQFPSTLFHQVSYFLCAYLYLIFICLKILCNRLMGVRKTTMILFLQ